MISETGLKGTVGQGLLATTQALSPLYLPDCGSRVISSDSFVLLDLWLAIMQGYLSAGASIGLQEA